MSDTTLKGFIAKVAADSKLQDQLKNITDKQHFTDTIIQLGKANGFQFSAEDVEATLFKSRNPLAELSEAELAMAAGGRPRATSDGCGSAWTTLFGAC